MESKKLLYKDDRFSVYSVPVPNSIDVFRTLVEEHKTSPMTRQEKDFYKNLEIPLSFDSDF